MIVVPEGECAVAALTRDGSLILAGGQDGPIRTWDARSGREHPVIGGNHLPPVRSLALSPDGRRVVSSSPDRLELSTGGLSRAGIFRGTALRVWDVATGRQLGEYVTDTEGLRPAFASREGSRLCIVGEEGSLLIWDVADGPPHAFDAREVVPDARSLSVSTIARADSDGKRVVAAALKRVPRRDPEPVLKIWEVEQGRARLLDYGSLGRSFAAMAIDPDARLAAFAHMPDIPPGQPGARDRRFSTLDLDTGEVASRLETPEGEGRYVHLLAFSPDGDRVAAGVMGGRREQQWFALHLWDARSGRLIRTYDSPAREALAVAFLPGGRLRVVSRDSQQVRQDDGGIRTEEWLVVWEAGPG